jgi:hypothetical protein
VSQSTAPPAARFPNRSSSWFAARFYSLIYLSMIGIGLKLVMDDLGLFH